MDSGAERAKRYRAKRAAEAGREPGRVGKPPGTPMSDATKAKISAAKKGEKSNEISNPHEGIAPAGAGARTRG